MPIDRREILERVARGELTPHEADALLSETDAEPPAPVADGGIRRVKLSIGVGRLEVVGDESVAVAEVDGPHEAEVSGDTFVIKGEWDAEYPGFAFTIGRRRHRVVAHEGRRGEKKLSSLSVRMNPTLELEARLDAGPLSIRGVRGPIQARCAAGPITIDDFEGPLDVAVNAGAVRATGKLTEGESRIRSDAGAVRVQLDPSSSVRIVAHAALGKVVVPGADAPKRSFGSDQRTATIGDGEATLRVETAMGSVHVSTL